MTYVIKDHSKCHGFKFKERSVSQVCHFTSAEFIQKGAWSRMIQI